jgi:hypothetical protein
MPGRNFGRVPCSARSVLVATLLFVFVSGASAGPRAADSPLPGHRLVVGVADQNASTFRQPLYRRLGLRISRLVVPWNAALESDRRAWVRGWLAAAYKAGVEPLVAFGRFSGQSMKPPSVAAYRRAFGAFRSAFPSVRTYTPWNEANHQAQPTFRRPGLAARYFMVMRSGCGGCRILAADVLDNHSAPKWLRQFLGALSGPPPQLWGLHNYIDVNRHHRIALSGTARVLATVPGQVWLTEVGGLVKTAALPYDEQRAAHAIRYLFTIAGALSNRIARVYVYNWHGVVTAAGARLHKRAWDSGLMEPNGRPRAGYFALRSELRLLRLGCWAGMPSLGRPAYLAGCA